MINISIDNIHPLIILLTFTLNVEGLNVNKYEDFRRALQPENNSTTGFKSGITCPDTCLDGNNCANEVCRNCFFACPKESCSLRQTTCQTWCTETDDCNRHDLCRGCLFCKENDEYCPIARFEEATASIVSKNETYWNQWFHSGNPNFHAGSPVFVDIDGDNKLDYFNSMHITPRLSSVSSVEGGFELGIAAVSHNTEARYSLEFYSDRIICIDPDCDNQLVDKHGSLVADLDADGYLDILVSNGGGGSFSGPAGSVDPQLFNAYDNWLFWGEPRVDLMTGENITVFIGGRGAARDAGVEMSLGRSRFNYLLDANGDGMIDIFGSQDRRSSNKIEPGVLLINQGNRTWRKDGGLAEYSRAMMVTDADGDGLAQEFILNRSFCYPFRKGPSTDPSLPDLGPYSSEIKEFCNTRPVGTNAIYRYNHTLNQMEEISSKYQNFWAGSQWTSPCCPNGSWDGINDCNAVSMGSGDFDDYQIADHVLLYGGKMTFFFSTDRSTGELPDNTKYVGLEITLPSYCYKARSLQIIDMDNNGKEEILVLCQNVGVILLYTQGTSKTDWKLQNKCNGKNALGAINNRFLAYPSDEEMIDFCAKYSDIDWRVADDLCDKYRRTKKPSFVNADGLAVVDMNNDGFQDIVTINNFGHLRFFYNVQSSETLKNQFISFKFIGDVQGLSNHYSIGATIILFCKDINTNQIVKQFREISSHQHHHDLYSEKDDRIVFGLGQGLMPERILVRFSTGRTQCLKLKHWTFSKENNPIEIMDLTSK
jgi:hypothetical protein